MMFRLLVPIAWLLMCCSGSRSLLAGDAGISKPKFPASQNEIPSVPPAEMTLAKPRNPRVLFVTADRCGDCEAVLTRLRRAGGDFESMQSAGWKIGPGPDNHIQIVNRGAVSDLVEKLGMREFPTVVCINDGEIVLAFQQGCTTPLDSWTLSWLMKGKNERPKPVTPELLTAVTTGNNPLRGNPKPHAEFVNW